MADTISRTIIISVVWISSATFLTFGLPSLADHRMNPSEFLPFCLAMVFLVLAMAMVVSIVVWVARRPRLDPKSYGFEVLPPVSVADQR